MITIEDRREQIEKLKILIIYGRKYVDGLSKDGFVEKIYKTETDESHFDFMKDFLKDHLVDDTELQNSVNSNNVNDIFYELQKLGHIVFAETSPNDHHKFGLVYLPKSISERQIKSLNELIGLLETEQYTIISLRNLRRENDTLTGNEEIGQADILRDIINKMDKGEVDEGR